MILLITLYGFGRNASILTVSNLMSEITIKKEWDNYAYRFFIEGNC